MRRALAGTAVVVLLAGCGDAATTTSTTTKADKRKPPTGSSIVAALAPLPGGGLRVGELSTGVVRDILPTARAVVRLPVSSGGQRGLLGLAVDARGRTFAAFTTRGGKQPLVVEQVAPGPRRRVWTGPASTDLADGGHLIVGFDGRLVIGIGDLQHPRLTPSGSAPNGKLLSLDPDGPPTQTPRILTRGWNNPYAFDHAPRRAQILVADNAPGRRPERIGRGDGTGRAPRDVTDLPGRIAPSGLAVLSLTEVAVCGVRSGRLDRFRFEAGTWRRQPGTRRACSYGVVRLTNGRLAVSTAKGIIVIPA